MRVTTEEMNLLERSHRRCEKRIRTGNMQYVRYKVFVNGVYDKTVTIKDYNYTEFTERFEQKFPEYKGAGTGSEYDHVR